MMDPHLEAVAYAEYDFSCGRGTAYEMVQLVKRLQHKPDWTTEDKQVVIAALKAYAKRELMNP